MKKIVVIGGGTGSYTVLRGLKKYEAGITSVITMFDSGGSSGILRDEFGVLPPGDVRRALVALAQDGSENVLRRLFEYRYDKKDSGLNGHNVGNLLLTALSDICGSEAEAIRTAGKLLAIKGNVLPVSVDHSNLCAELENGTTIVGETNISAPKHKPDLRISRVYLYPAAKIYEETRQAILDADLIIIGPGDLYTSVIPNLLVAGMQDALLESRAKKAYVCNLMTKLGETHNYTASDHAKEVLCYAPVGIDCIICNKTIPGDSALLEKYAEERSYIVSVDERNLPGLAKRIILEDLITEPVLIRHDSDKLAKVIMEL